MSDFADALAALCARELPYARRDPGRLADMLERLTSSLAMTIAVGGKGDERAVSALLEGATQLLFTEAANRADLGKLFGRLPT